MKTTIKVDGTRLTVGAVKTCYVNVFEAKSSFEGVNPKFSTRILIDKADPEIEKILSGITQAIENAKVIAKEKGKFSKGFPANGKIPLKDGDVELNGAGEQTHPGYWYMDCKANETDRPGVVDIHHNPILDQSAVYSGCFAVVALVMFGYETPANKGISCGLSHFMKVADGEPMGGKVSVNKAFEGFNFGGDDLLN